MRLKTLIVGSGGREHALAHAISKSPLLEKLYAAPGNAGIADQAECLSVKAEDTAGIVRAVQEKKIDFVIIGPEGPLVAGLADVLEKIGVPAFGPKAAPAQIEGSKAFMKDLCRKTGVPTAAYARFDNPVEAQTYVVATSAASNIPANEFSIVVKASGLAAGKGVTVATNVQEALDAINNAKNFGTAGDELVIEEYMEGEEVSFFALVDGENAISFASAQDHKRAGDGDTGPNTGGMGAYSPAPIFTKQLEEQVMHEIILPPMQALAKAGTPYRGVLFAGLMLTKTGPKLIEFNARFGDPETQAMLPRLKSDLLDALYKTATGKLNKVKLEWSGDTALTVVMAARGYPGEYRKNTVIKGLDKAAAQKDAIVFHAGTAKSTNGEILSIGGRVLGVTGLGADAASAQKAAYRAVDQIDWKESFCRRDIGWRAIRK